MTDVTFDYPSDGTRKTLPIGLNIIDFVDGIIKFADGTKEDLPYKLSDYIDHDHMSYLYITTGSEADTDVQLITTIEYDSDNDPIYIGEAAPSTSKSDPLWRIKKITYDASKNPTDIQYADGTQTFTKVWNDRATYSYS